MGRPIARSGRRAALHRLGAACVLASGLLPGARAAAADSAVHGMVIQVTSGDSRRWHAVLGNVHNIQAEMGAARVPITVVAIAAAIGMLTDESLAANTVQDLQAAGVDFVACGNSMQALHVAADQLLPGVRTVPAGYVEIHRLQQAGWTYLVP